ncbi:RNA polymerase ECF-type sigma factor [Lunatimonas lonarensis]|uniref:RNA polymerase ECF-type sigma factor n=1 Tax=Lunatimonas lonarensis TaxID=1232681 RepID=R7ZRA1_9BACT|nr:sigma-70 family RNA polymerase sigma factor [Lunatimonas lonarensis]EON76645.1 RNA polymerase ECF-type sigma factor [Lunatimonas lonarensis]
MNKQSDIELFLGCLNGNPSAQRALYERYAPKMFGVCFRYIKETAAAEDILIIGFTKVFDRIHQFKGTGNFGGWIRRIMVNECLMYMEKPKNLNRDIGLDGILPSSTQSQPSDELAVEDLMKLIEALPRGYKKIFNLYAIEGFSHQEIAEKLNISESTSKSQLSRARSHLQRMVADRTSAVKPILNLS